MQCLASQALVLRAAPEIHVEKNFGSGLIRKFYRTGIIRDASARKTAAPSQSLFLRDAIAMDERLGMGER